MTDRPILFSGPMFRALLEGRKTQTRRLAKPAWVEGANQNFTRWEAERVGSCDWILKCTHIGARIKVAYQSGDRLWVREAHALLPRTAYRMSVGTGTVDQREHPTDNYTAAVFREGFDRSGKPKWRPSILMPRWASRLTLIVTDVRVERLQSISDEDAMEEGLLDAEDDGWGICYSGTYWEYPVPPSHLHHYPRDAYAALWESLNAKRGFGWDTNPWVVAITFTVHQTNIDEMESGNEN